MKRIMKLSPVQRLAFDRLLGGIASAEVLVLRGPAGAGKTTILRQAHATMGGALVSVRPHGFLGILEEAIFRHSLVFIDDLHLLGNVVEDPGALLLDAAFTAILGDAAGQRKKLVFATSEEPPWSIRLRAATVEIGAARATIE